MTQTVAVSDREIDVSAYDPRVALADPYPTYKALLEQDPVHWVESTGIWVVTPHALIREVMTDDVTYGQRYQYREISRQGEAVAQQPYFQMFRRMFFVMDGEDHQRIRPLFARWFMGPARSRQLAPLVERATNETLDALSGAKSFDIVKDFANPVPLRVISEILGVPPADSERIAHDIEDIAPVVESMPKDIAVQRRADAAIGRLEDYFRDLIATRRRNMGDDLLSSIIEAGDAGSFADEQELLANVLLMYFAGHDTTTSALSLAILSLHRHPDQLALLRRSPEIMPMAVEELLRFDNTSQGFSRSSTQDVEVGGQKIKAGTFILLLLAAGNRDPSVFENPHTLDLRRDPKNMLAFGGGAHVCIGNMLARMELRTAIGALNTRFPNLELETIDPPASAFRHGLTRAVTELRARV